LKISEMNVYKQIQRCLICIFLVFLLCCTVYGGTEEFRILYVNDFHGFAQGDRDISSGELQGGIAYLAFCVEKLRSEKHSILVAAGDMIQGDAWANLFKGKSVIEIMNAMGFDAMVVGNHEFDFGQDVLKERISEAQFPVLGANVVGFGGLRPYIIKEIGGLKIGIIGVVTEETPQSTHPKNVTGIHFLPPGETVEKFINEIHEKVNLILVLSHVGYTNDRILAHRVKGIDIIVGGHSHTKLVSPVFVENTIVVQAFEHGKVLGVLDVTLKDGKIDGVKGRLEEIQPRTMTKHEIIAKIVERYEHAIDALMNVKIGEAEETMSAEYVRTRETSIGNFVADIVRETAQADIAIINGGSIRKSIHKGAVTLGDIYSALPFDNYIVALKLRGREIKDILEHGVSAVEEKSGRFPLVSGIAFTYRPMAAKGSRIVTMYVHGKPLEYDKEYSVATNDFLAMGGDGYTTFAHAIQVAPNYSSTGGTLTSSKLIYNDAGRYVRDIVADYIKTKRYVSSRIERRIQEIE